MRKTVTLLLTSFLTLASLSGCGNNAANESSDKIKIEFFHYKTEAKGTFDQLIEKFEEENPGIDVVQSNPPDSETVLKMRVVKREIPDVIGIGANFTFADLANAKIFKDLTGNELLKDIQPDYVQMMKEVPAVEEVYAVPYAANASAVIYNKDIFKELGLEVPTTWDEFIKTAETIKAAGKIPFYFTFKDAWTTLPSYNALAANTQGETFYQDLRKGETTFAKGHKEAAEKLLKLVEYGHKAQYGRAYSDGNIAFAKGESAMYLQGIWAIPEIKKANPDINLGVFPYPVTNKPGGSKLVSGVDLLLAFPTTSEHPEEAKKFVEFLLDDENIKTYINQQNAFSAKKSVVQEDPVLEGLKASIEKGELLDFPDHYVPIAVGLEKQLQVLTQKKDVDQFLKTLDKEWSKVQDRQ
ncbi:ABC transporter substrate-binding protein [Metabacillus arenae]|uniref:Maltodextrin-binding protein n=1 Tax=Metabacillus arenae TaxID=2771434 RepID=A0A926RW20_9BACI|nr:extracellular solute-binding protein [Metabacillus arenae]MBD1380313.1 extracellular solute-binding protein [Metabacillus arenae]